jgi:HPt (histidine-containing phosphotransfer) domain-containing protein
LLTQLQNREYDKLSKTVHNIKGISSSYMAENVYRLSFELDSLLKTGKTKETEGLVNRLTNDIIEAAGDIVNHYRL